MKTILKVLAFALILPLAAFAAASGALSKIDSDVRARVLAQYPDLPPPKLLQLSVPYLDARHAFASPELPRLYRHLEFARTAAIVTGAAGLTLIAAIAAAGYGARRRREWLVRLFKPGVYVTLGGAAILTTAQAAEVIYAGYYYESATIGQVHLQFLALLGLGGLFASVAVVRAALALFKKVRGQIFGVEVLPEAQPALWTEVEEVCRLLQAPRPDHIVLGLEPTFFVTEAEVTCSGREVSGRTLFLSLSLMRLLTRDEQRTVIGHELAHFAGEDTKYSQHFFPVYRGTLMALARLKSGRQTLSTALARLPAIAFVGFFFQSFMLAEKEVSRDRERNADQLGARVGGPAALGSALVKLHAYGPLWKEIYFGLRERGGKLEQERNASALLRQQALSAPSGDLHQAGARQLPHPTDSHPTLAARLEYLQLKLPEVAGAAAIPTAEASGWSLVQGAESLEEQQTAELRAR
jgi:Zn-dependent protease with chaperone function